jgi:hypothetical protein
MTSHVRSRAARDLGCGKADTQVEDTESGVYRVTGCGLVAGYQCTDGTALKVHCARLYVSKLPDGAGPKAGSGSSLAKAR